MNKKDPISFKDRKRQKKITHYQPPRGGGELDDVRTYWVRFFHNPFAGPGRLMWTERMLWGNALIAGILTIVGGIFAFGFKPLTLFSLFINAFFVFFLVYYLMPWVMNWILIRLQVRQSSVDSLKLEMIVISGWLVAVNLIRLIPYIQPLLYDCSVLLFGILTVLSIRRVTRASWGQAILSSLGGALSVVIVLTILAYI